MRVECVWKVLCCACDHGCVVLCRYDGTVRNSAGDVVQFLYGEDGMDGVRIEGQVRDAETVPRTRLFERLHG